MALQRMDVRREERFLYLKAVKHVRIPDTDEVCKGVTIAISKSGMSLYIFSPAGISEGFHVRISDNMPLAATSGVVRWVQQVDQDLYRAGLQFR